MTDSFETPDEVHARIATRYKEARFVVGIVDAFGLLIAIAGFAWFGWSVFGIGQSIFSALSNQQPLLSSILSFIGMWPALALIVTGVLIFAHGQLVRATLDSADLTRESLLMLERGSR